MGLRQALRVFFAACEDRRTIEARGMELLRSHLSPIQRDQFSAVGCFEVTGSDTGCRYLIRNTTSINVEQLGNDGQCVRKWCFIPEGSLVQGDVLLAQKFALECFEGEALKHAHHFPPYGQEGPGRR
jgi:hypothetical protein